MLSHFSKLRKSKLSLIDDVKDLLPQTDINNAREMVEYNEFGVGFEIICEQLFENDIKISSNIYEKIVAIGKSMEMKETSWNFLETLLKND